MKPTEVIRINNYNISKIKIDKSVSDKVEIDNDAIVRYLTNRYSYNPHELKLSRETNGEVYGTDSFVVKEGHVQMIFKIKIQNQTMEILDLIIKIS